MKNLFKDTLLDHNKFAVTVEIVPGRGAREILQQNALQWATMAAESGLICGVSITDNPGGNPALAPEFLGQEVLALGIEPIIHVTCKDKNRNQIEGQLYALDRVGIRNIITMTGDYTNTAGFGGRGKPVFDIDPVHTLQLVQEMNSGLSYSAAKGLVTHEKSDFFAGVAASPFKATEAEQICQYNKVQKKLAAGADYIISQVGYDARKIDELYRYVRASKTNLPLIASIFVLPLGIAKVMNSGGFAGCVVTDKLVQEIAQEVTADDKGLQARLDRAAKTYAIAKGIGYAGACINGFLTHFEQLEYIIHKGNELAPNWQQYVEELNFSVENGFYYFTKDEKTCLNTAIPVSTINTPLPVKVNLGYRLARSLNKFFYTPNKGFHQIGTKKWKQMKKSKLFYKLEHKIKIICFDCKDCGDCALADLAFLCPMSQCAKQQRNGPCGGSKDGWCEVYPSTRRCLYVRAYSRLKYYDEENMLGYDGVHHCPRNLLQGPCKGVENGYCVVHKHNLCVFSPVKEQEPKEVYIVPPCNWDLYHSSSLANYYGGQDHAGKKLKDKQKQQEADHGK